MRPVFTHTSKAFVADSQMSSYKMQSIAGDQHQSDREPDAHTLNEVCAYPDTFRLCVGQRKRREIALVGTAASELVDGAYESLPVFSQQVGSVVGCSLIFGLSKGEASTKVLEGVVFNGHNVGYRVVCRLQSFLHREQSFPGGVVGLRR
jgi:hypothetical protein